jgi:hypothetical protein
MLLEPSAIECARRVLSAEAFHSVQHGRMFRALLALRDRDEPTDFITLTEELRRRAELELVGGPEAVALVFDFATTAANVEAHANIVREAYAKRRVGQLALRLLAGAEDPTSRAADLLTGMQPDSVTIAALLDVADGKADSAAAIEYLDFAKIREHGIPSVRWIVEGWLAEKDIGLVSGDGGIGKSTTTADLSIAVATGRDWCGIPIIKSGKVLVFDEEQSEDEVSRLYLRLGAPHPNLHVASQHGVNLTTAAGLKRLERELDERHPVLVVLDSVQQVFAGVDGNNAGEVARVYAELFRLRRLYDTTFVLIGHLRKPPADGQVPKLHLVHGSVAFATQASTVWVATQPADNLLDLCQVKRRGGERTSLRIRYASEGNDAPIVLTGEGVVEAQETTAERAQDFAVSYLTEKGTSTTAWILKAAEPHQLTARAVQRALAHLVKIGRVEKPTRGYYSLRQEAMP